MGCCWKKPKTDSKSRNEEAATAASQKDPLINGTAPASPNTQRKKKKGKGQPAEVNPFHKPRKYYCRADLSFLTLVCCLQGVL